MLITYMFSNRLTETGLRLAAFIVDYLDRCPLDTLGESGSDGFENRFLDREPSGERQLRVDFGKAVLDLPGCENPRQKAVTISFDRFSYPGDIRQIDTHSFDIRTHEY